MADLTALKTLAGDPPTEPRIRQGGGGRPCGPAANAAQQAGTDIKTGSASEIKPAPASDMKPDPASEIKKPRKKPGRPKGSGKWPGSGRKPGHANQSTKGLRAKIHRRGKPVETVCDVAAGKLEIEGMSRADALKLLYKSVVPEYRVQEVTGADGGAVETRAVNVIEEAQILSKAFAAVNSGVDANSDSPDILEPKLEGDALEAAKTVAFAHELAKHTGGSAREAQARIRVKAGRGEMAEVTGPLPAEPGPDLEPIADPGLVKPARTPQAPAESIPAPGRVEWRGKAG